MTRFTIRNHCSILLNSRTTGWLPIQFRHTRPHSHHKDIWNYRFLTTRCTHDCLHFMILLYNTIRRASEDNIHVFPNAEHLTEHQTTRAQSWSYITLKSVRVFLLDLVYRSEERWITWRREAMCCVSLLQKPVTLVFLLLVLLLVYVRVASVAAPIARGSPHTISSIMPIKETLRRQE